MVNCIACAEEIKPEAKLCRFCGTLQNDEKFSTTQTAARSKKESANSSKSQQKLACPKCGQIDRIQKVGAIVDSGTVTSASFGFMSQMGHVGNMHTGLNMGQSSNILAQRLSIGIPTAEYKFRFSIMLLCAVFIWAALLGGVFKEGSPADLSPVVNVIASTLLALILAPFAAMWIASQRLKNDEIAIRPLQQVYFEASERLRKAYYCSRDDLVFDKKLSGTPEDFIESLLQD